MDPRVIVEDRRLPMLPQAEWVKTWRVRLLMNDACLQMLSINLRIPEHNMFWFDEFF